MAALREVDLSTGGCSSLELTMTKRFQGRRGKTDHIVLRECLYKHRYNAYPTRAEKLVLANKTQLTEKQVSKWFINARRRILPEIFRREGRDPQKFIRTRVCSSLFSSTSGSGHISSTSYFCNLFFWVQNILPRCLIGLLTKMAQQNILADPVTKNAFSPI